MRIEEWSIEGAEGQPIIGNAHLPGAEPRGVFIIAHGFKGYKDYGMFPCIADTLCREGFIAHRFNFSHSGMTHKTDTFEREDLFGRDTWNKQVFDLSAVVRAITLDDLPGQGLSYVLFGHSRGGATVLLTAGRHADDATFPPPAGIATAAAPSTTNMLTSEQAEEMEAKGYIVSPSSRTGQDLRIGVQWLVEQREDPEGHHLLRQVAKIRCPLLIIHGQDDPTVPPECADKIAGAAGDARKVIINSADHVFNTPNPFPPNAEPSRELAMLLDELVQFSNQCCA